jgi:hypothetical protein
MARLKYQDERLRPNGKAIFKFCGENLLMIGYAGEDPLVYFMKSEPENLWNYYRLFVNEDAGEGKRYAWDARRHDPDHLFDHAKNPVDIIVEALKKLEGRELTPEEFYQPKSTLVATMDEQFGEPPKVEKVEEIEEKPPAVDEALEWAKKIDWTTKPIEPKRSELDLVYDFDGEKATIRAKE